MLSVANQWLESANLKFNFSAVDFVESEIRISFSENEGTWSFVGTDALNVVQDSATMNFGWLNPNSSDDEIALAVLPQFGYALGLYNEHQNPNAEIPWDLEKVRKNMSGAPNFWSEAQIEHQFFRKWPPNAFPFKKEFDPNSVMFQAFNKEWLDIELPDQQKTTLSHGDKEFISKLYPKP